MMLYAIHDYDPALKKKGAFVVNLDQAKRLNNEGYGIFWTPNVFMGARKAENCTKIRFWLADIDEGSKEEQWARIEALPLRPSSIVETKKGYHCYWKAENADLDTYREIECGLIKRLNADKACKDVCRLLRYPNFYHNKDKEHPFLVKTVQINDNEYTKEQMLCVYQLPKPIYKPIKYEGEKEEMLKPENWNKIFRLNQAMAEGRNNFLTRVTFWLRDAGFDRGTIDTTIHNMNALISTPLDEWEVKSILRGKI